MQTRKLQQLGLGVGGSVRGDYSLLQLFPLSNNEIRHVLRFRRYRTKD